MSDPKTGKKKDRRGTYWRDGDKYGWSSGDSEGKKHKYHEHSRDDRDKVEDHVQGWEWEEDDD